MPALVGECFSAILDMVSDRFVALKLHAPHTCFRLIVSGARSRLDSVDTARLAGGRCAENPDFLGVMSQLLVLTRLRLDPGALLVVSVMNLLI